MDLNPGLKKLDPRVKLPGPTNQSAVKLKDANPSQYFQSVKWATQLDPYLSLYLLIPTPQWPQNFSVAFHLTKHLF